MCIDLSENPIGSVGFGSIVDGLTASQVKTIGLNKCDIGQECGPALSALFSRQTTTTTALEKFDMSDNPIGYEALAQACEALKHSNSVSLNTVFIWGRDSEDHITHASLAVDLLQANQYLTALDFGFANVPIEFTTQIQELLRENIRKRNV
jgi:hypothetical protein